MSLKPSAKAEEGESSDLSAGLRPPLLVHYAHPSTTLDDPMTTILSDDLRQAIEKEGGSPVHLVDAATNVHYVLMRTDQDEKVKAVFEHEDRDVDPREAYPFVEEVMREDDANDPTLSSYQSFTKREP